MGHDNLRNEGRGGASGRSLSPAQPRKTPCPPLTCSVMPRPGKCAGSKSAPERVDQPRLQKIGTLPQLLGKTLLLPVGGAVACARNHQLASVTARKRLGGADHRVAPDHRAI